MPPTHPPPPTPLLPWPPRVLGLAGHDRESESGKEVVALCRTHTTMRARRGLGAGRDAAGGAPWFGFERRCSRGSLAGSGGHGGRGAASHRRGVGVGSGSGSGLVDRKGWRGVQPHPACAVRRWVRVC